MMPVMCFILFYFDAVFLQHFIRSLHALQLLDCGLLLALCYKLYCSIHKNTESSIVYIILITHSHYLEINIQKTIRVLCSGRIFRMHLICILSLFCSYHISLPLILNIPYLAASKCFAPHISRLLQSLLVPIYDVNVVHIVSLMSYSSLQMFKH
eukprot:742940_1